MPRQKSYEKKLAEGRGQGEGADYTAILKANEAHSRACAAQIYDPIAGRMVDTMSAVETMFFYNIRLDPTIVSIREQYPLDMDAVRKIQDDLGVRKATGNWSTDFVVKYTDGRTVAYSVKSTFEDFDAGSPKYLGREKKYYSLVLRQHTEMLYWQRQGAEFVIVTKEFLNRRKAVNTQLLLSFWHEEDCVNTEQKMLYLIVHGILPQPADINTAYIKPKALANTFRQQGVDIDALFAADAAAGVTGKENTDD